MDHYAVLGVPQTASDAEIRSAYKKLARRVHPDKNQGHKPVVDVDFGAVQAAYEVLSNPDDRRLHDAELESKKRVQPNYAGPDELMSFFGSRCTPCHDRGRQRSTSFRPRDAMYDDTRDYSINDCQQKAEEREWERVNILQRAESQYKAPSAAAANAISFNLHSLPV